MQCSRMISFARATYNKCLRTTDCNLVCSLEQESHTAPFMLSVHSPDNVFMVLVHIFISNHNHFLCSLLPLSCSARNHCFMKYWNIEHNTLKSYGRTDRRTVVQFHLYVSAFQCPEKIIPGWQNIMLSLLLKQQNNKFHGSLHATSSWTCMYYHTWRYHRMFWIS